MSYFRVHWIIFLFTALYSLSAIPQESGNRSSIKIKKSGKVQEVNFEEMTLSGQIRSPQGAYLIQKNGIKFLPLYEVKKNVDGKIRESVEWLR
ncbi:MAG: hypothetical protein NZ480_04495 [Bdellovibrionaceae bacterium]|nr:hypothetical protein [Pseudobdellovibrionaceae bacterium]MDW8189801.1 hypothetical protein [Pseudobdellovibrionaceae bacterium]